MPVENKKPRKVPARKSNDLDGKSWIRNSISIWSEIRKTPEEVALKHPAIFPAQLASRMIETFTRNDQKVILDPFSGIGSTVLAAEAVGKTGIGFDISADYISKSRNRNPLETSDDTILGKRCFVQADVTNLLDYVEPNSVDMCLTSPPYWDILLQKRNADGKDIRNYGDSELDLGRISDYHTFIDKLGTVFEGVLKVLKPDSYCCVIVMDLRKGPNFYPLHSDLTTKMQEIGYLFDDIIIWDRRHEYNNFRPLGYPSVFRVNKAHEYILIFKKPA